MFSFTSKSLTETVSSIRLYSQATIGPWTFVFPGNDAAVKMARPEGLFVPSAIPYNLLPLVSTLLFFRTGDVLVSKFFDNQTPSDSTEKLVLPCHARCASLSSSLQRTQPFAKFLSF